MKTIARNLATTPLVAVKLDPTHGVRVVNVDKATPASMVRTYVNVDGSLIPYSVFAEYGDYMRYCGDNGIYHLGPREWINKMAAVRDYYSRSYLAA